jgi:heme-degrading monooxygenase HmoA
MHARRQSPIHGPKQRRGQRRIFIFERAVHSDEGYPEHKHWLCAATVDLEPVSTHHRFTMILELADIRIQPGQQAAFDEAIQRGVDTVISKAKGFEGFKINRGIESPERYVLQIFWTTLENHTVDFRESPAFAEWRAIVGPFFAQPPMVEHFELVSKSHG